MAVSVKLLGGFEATVDGVVVPDSAWRLKKARELVKLLALARGHRLHRDQALDVLWRELAPAAAANNLHQAVHVARRALGADAIDVRDEVLSLAGDVDVDVDLLELAAADARRMKTAAAYRAVLALYRGELLPENRYDDWAEGRREELARARRRARRGVGGARHDGTVRPARGYELVRRSRARALGAGFAAPAHACSDAVGRRRRREDAARAPARALGRAVVRVGRRARRARSRSPTRGSSRTRSQPRSTSGRSPRRS